MALLLTKDMTATVVGPPQKEPCLSCFIAVELLCKSAKAMEKSEMKTIRVCQCKLVDGEV